MQKGLSFIVLSYLLQSQVVAHFEFFSNFAQDRLCHGKDYKLTCIFALGSHNPCTKHYSLNKV